MYITMERYLTQEVMVKVTSAVVKSTINDIYTVQRH